MGSVKARPGCATEEEDRQSKCALAQNRASGKGEFELRTREGGGGKRAGTSPVNARRFWKGRPIFSRATENGPAFRAMFRVHTAKCRPSLGSPGWVCVCGGGRGGGGCLGLDKALGRPAGPRHIVPAREPPAEPKRWQIRQGRPSLWCRDLQQLDLELQRSLHLPADKCWQKTAAPRGKAGSFALRTMPFFHATAAEAAV